MTRDASGVSSRLRETLCLTMAIVWMWSCPAIARAQEAPDPARDAFNRGMAALQGSRFRDAAEALEASWRGRPMPVVLYNLGLAYRGMGRNLDAVDTFERYLSAPEPGVSPQRLSALRQEIERLRGTLVRLQVTLRPPRATLRMDGRPLVVIDGEALVDPGVHTVDGAAEGHQPAHRELDLAPGSRETFEMVLVPVENRARLRVVPSVIESDVYVDQWLVGVGRTDVDVPPGRHTVEVRATGYTPYQDVVWSTGRGDIWVSAALQRVRFVPREGRRAPGWVLPVALVGGAVVIAGAIVLTAWLLRGTAAVGDGAWGTFCEGACP